MKDADSGDGRGTAPLLHATVICVDVDNIFWGKILVILEIGMTFSTDFKDSNA